MIHMGVPETAGTPSPLDVAWAAGLFEGEGTIWNRQRNGYTGLGLAMQDPDVVEKFQRIVGGPEVRKRKGGLNRQGVYVDMWEWRIEGKDDIARVLNLLLPHLQSRRYEKAFDAIERDRRLEWGVVTQ